MVEKLNFGQCYKLGKTIFDNSYQKCLVYYSIYDVNLSKNKTKKSNYLLQCNGMRASQKTNPSL